MMIHIIMTLNAVEAANVACVCKSLSTLLTSVEWKILALKQANAFMGRCGLFISPLFKFIQDDDMKRFAKRMHAVEDIPISILINVFRAVLQDNVDVFCQCVIQYPKVLISGKAGSDTSTNTNCLFTDYVFEPVFSLIVETKSLLPEDISNVSWYGTNQNLQSSLAVISARQLVTLSNHVPSNYHQPASRILALFPTEFWLIMP